MPQDLGLVALKQSFEDAVGLIAQDDNAKVKSLRKAVDDTHYLWALPRANELAQVVALTQVAIQAAIAQHGTTEARFKAMR